MKKRTKLIIISMTICLVLIAGVTFAYLTNMSNEKVNTFTASDGISITLAEPAWDGMDHGATIEPEDESELGKTLAKNFVPGRIIPKDPDVKNTSDEPVWVAIKLDYSGIANSYALVNAFADIDFNTTDWEAKDSNYSVFYFNSILEPGLVTEELFTRVLIDAGVAASALEDFEIKIKAYAVQSEGVDEATARLEIDALMQTSP